MISKSAKDRKDRWVDGNSFGAKTFNPGFIFNLPIRPPNVYKLDFKKIDHRVQKVDHILDNMHLFV
jgi:hypothetical protein